MITHISIRMRLLVFVLGFVLAILATVSVLFFLNSRSSLHYETEERAKAKVNNAVTALEGFLLEKSKIAWTALQQDRVIAWVANNDKRMIPNGIDPVYDQIMADFRKLVKADGQIYSVFLSSEKTQAYWNCTDNVDLKPDYVVSSRPWYQNAVKKGGPVFDVDFDFFSKEILVNYRFPIIGQGKRWLGVGGVDISLKKFQQFMASLAETFKTGQAILLHTDGTILYHPDANLVLTKKLADFGDDGKNYTGLAPVLADIQNGILGARRVRFAGEQRSFIYAPIRSVGWTLLLSVAASEIDAPLNSLARSSAVIIAIAFIILVLLLLLVSRSIIVPIQQLQTTLQEIAQGEGDLSQRIVLSSRDELGALAGNFNHFIEKIQEIIDKVKVSSQENLQLSQVIASSSEKFYQSLTDEKTFVGQTDQALHVFSEVVAENRQNTDYSQKTIFKFNEEIQAKRSLIVDVTSTMNEIRQAGSHIGEIVSVINDISFQTNLLALNAAVEAARAGEAGRGFAVVASEVRNLAQKTADSSKTIQSIVSTNIEATQRGMDLVTATAKFFDSIVGQLNEVVKSIEKIASGSSRQQEEIDGIKRSMNELEGLIGQNQTLSRQFLENGQKLAGNATELEKLVEKFKV